MQNKILKEELLNDQNINKFGKIKSISYKDNIFEFELGASKIGAKYIQRLGSPGNYIYIYLPKQMSGLNRRARFAYGRMIKNASMFLNKFKMRYGAKRIGIKPKSWTKVVADFETEDGGFITHLFNIKYKTNLAYKVRREPKGGAYQINKMRKAGILRYR